MFKILAVSLAALFATPMMHALADSPALTRTITVNGHGETKAAGNASDNDHFGVFTHPLRSSNKGAPLASSLHLLPANLLQACQEFDLGGIDLLARLGNGKERNTINFRDG